MLPDGDGTASSAAAQSSDVADAASAAVPVHDVRAHEHHVEVNIKTTDGNVTTLKVPRSSSGLDLKTCISERLEVPPDRQRLIVRGHVLKDEDVVGQRITEDGQTVHLVQRPEALPGADPQAQESNRAAAQSQAPHAPVDAATFTAANLLQASGGPAAAGVQLRFQLNTPQDGQPMPAEVSQMFNSLFGPAGRDLFAGLGAGGPPGSNSEPAVNEPSVGDAGGARSGNGDEERTTSRWTSLIPGRSALLRMGLWSSRACLAGLPLIVLAMSVVGGWFTVALQASLGGSTARTAQAASSADAVDANVDSEGTTSGSHLGNILPLYGWLICYHAVSLCLGLPALYVALRTSPPVRMISSWLGSQHLSQSQTQAQGAVEAAQILFGQRIATMTLPTSQIIFQGSEQSGTSQVLIGQGLANQADLVSALLGNMNAVPQEAAPQDTAPQDAAPQDAALQEAEPLPWEELQDLSQHLACLLHRPEHSSALRPLHMPHGELHAFLSVLHGATSQLGVGISDMQTSLCADRGEEQQHQQALHFANVADATASVLHSLAASVRSRRQAPHTEAGSISMS